MGKSGYILLSALLILALVTGQPGIVMQQGRVVLTLGPPDAYAAGDADYSLDGTDDNVQVQAALNALPAAGGVLHFKVGTYSFSATPTRAIANVIIEGEGRGTLFNYDAGTPLFTAGGNNWVFRDFATDAGSINMGATTGWVQANLLLGATYVAYASAGDHIPVISSPAQGDIVYYNGSDWVALTAGTNNGLLKTQGAGANPAWTLTPVLTSVNATTIDILNNGQMYHTSANGQRNRFYARGLLDNYGDVSSEYFGENAGDPNSKASFMTATGTGACAGASDNLSEGNACFGTATMSGGSGNVTYSIAINDGALRYIQDSDAVIGIGDHIAYANPFIGEWGTMVGSQANNKLANGSKWLTMGSNAAWTATYMATSVVGGHNAGYGADRIVDSLLMGPSVVSGVTGNITGTIALTTGSSSGAGLANKLLIGSPSIFIIDGTLPNSSLQFNASTVTVNGTMTFPTGVGGLSMNGRSISANGGIGMGTAGISAIGGLTMANTAPINAPNTDDNTVTFGARDNGVGIATIARLVGAADPYFEATKGLVLAPVAQWGTPVTGALIYNTSTSKINFWNGSAWEVVTSAP